MIDRLEHSAECEHESLRRMLKQVVPHYQAAPPQELQQPRRAA